jgi:hypothetical protein
VERRLALEHELVLHKRGDIWWNLAATLVLAIFWFNPVAWLAFRAFRSDQELACDAAVARTASLDERCDYARALVKSASRPGLIAACALNPAGELKRRLRMMRNHRASPLRSTGGVVALAAFAMAGFALGSAGRPPATEAAGPYASVPPAAAAASPAPVALAAAAQPEPSVVVTARRHARAAAVPVRARLAVEPMSFASAEAPAPRPSPLLSMATMLRRLPRSAVVPRALPVPRLASVEGVPGEAQVVRFTRRVHAEAHVYTIGEALSEEEAAEIRRAVIQAAAEGRKLRFEVQRAESSAGGGGQSSGFDINIQTLVKGE